MTGQDLIVILARLRLSQSEAATLLGITARTVRRWIENKQAIPGPAIQALHAWMRLNDRNLPWRPDSESIVEDDQDQIALLRQHAIGLDEMLERVDMRGGPSAPWEVDLDTSVARLGPIEISFYRLPNGGFSLSTYTRKDQMPDVHRDCQLIEDGAACIAIALARRAL